MGQAFDSRTAVRLAEELLSKPDLSKELCKMLEGSSGTVNATTQSTSIHRKTLAALSDLLHLKMATDPVPPTPNARRLHVYAYDPSLSSDLANFDVNEATVSIACEKELKPGRGLAHTGCARNPSPPSHTHASSALSDERVAWASLCFARIRSWFFEESAPCLTFPSFAPNGSFTNRAPIRSLGFSQVLRVGNPLRTTSQREFRRTSPSRFRLATVITSQALLSETGLRWKRCPTIASSSGRI